MRSAAATSPTPRASQGIGEGIDVAYYLVHAMAGGAGFAEREQQGAVNFARAALREGVGRVVYLGGLGDASVSKHLRSRHETALALASEGPPLTYFRAAMVVGAESESYRTLRHLVKRLPVMIAPAWLKIATQPIAIDDVIAYLLAAPHVPESTGREVQIGGPDVLSYGEMLDRMAIAMGMRPRPKIPVPFITPWLSALWLGPGHAGRHERRAAAGGGADDGDGGDRPLGRERIRDRAGLLRRGARARAGAGETAKAPSGMSGALVLFTRDLRVHDHPALGAAAREHEHVAARVRARRGAAAGSAGHPEPRRLPARLPADLRRVPAPRAAPR